jgi:hypothetical protein
MDRPAPTPDAVAAISVMWVPAHRCPESTLGRQIPINRGLETTYLNKPASSLEILDTPT